jgi:hypothetical protein
MRKQLEETVKSICRGYRAGRDDGPIAKVVEEQP